MQDRHLRGPQLFPWSCSAHPPHFLILESPLVTYFVWDTTSQITK